MRVCVLGAGAIGGLLGARLALSGAEVTLLDRGPQLTALRNRGLTVIDIDGKRRRVADVRVTGNPRECEDPELVILAVRGCEIHGAYDSLQALLNSNAVLMPVQSGLPWWYFQRREASFAGHVLRAVDPEGWLAAGINPARIIGCVAYPAAELVSPATVRHVGGSAFPVGELDGLATDRAARISDLLQEAGFKSRVIDDIRAEIWLKVWGALCFDPISALTGMSMAEICRYSPTRRLAEGMMREAEDVARGLGVRMSISLERRMAGAERAGGHNTPMLEDVTAGRRLEIEPLLGTIIEMAGLVHVETPTLRLVYDLAKALDWRLQHGERFGAEVASLQVQSARA